MWRRAHLAHAHTQTPSDTRSFVGNLLALRRIILQPSCDESETIPFGLWMVPSPPPLPLRTILLTLLSFFFPRTPVPMSLLLLRFCAHHRVCYSSHFDGVHFSLSSLLLFRQDIDNGSEGAHTHTGKHRKAGRRHRIIINLFERNNKRMCSRRRSPYCMLRLPQKTNKCNEKSSCAIGPYTIPGYTLYVFRVCLLSAQSTQHP